MGRPGKPAPEPTSITCGTLAAGRWLLGSAWTAEGSCPRVVRAEGKRWRAANRDSPKWRVTIWSGSRTAVRLMRAFQRRSISMYVDIPCSWEVDSTAYSLRLRSGQALPAEAGPESRAVAGLRAVKNG